MTEVVQLFPEHAQSLISLIKRRNTCFQELQQAEQNVTVLLGLLGIPNEIDTELKMLEGNRVEITRTRKIVSPNSALVAARN